MQIHDLAALARSVRLPTDEAQVALTRSYFTSYQVCVDRLSKREPFDASDAVLAASMSYSWLPRALRLDPTALPGAVVAMNDARGGALTAEVIEGFSALVEGSVIAASKALHFAVPSTVPIYDRRVHEAFFGRSIPWSKRKRRDAFLEYAATLRALVAHVRFVEEVRAPALRVFEELGQAQPGLTLKGLSDLRVAELTLFYSRAP
ncbi:MAG: hypothetical protein RLP09_03355 [Sandaracinaceae bacterium]